MKSYTDLEQSKALAKILPLESTDMRYGYTAPYDYSDRMYDGGYDEIPYPNEFIIKNPNFSANEYDAELPCWSLTALLGVLPTIDDEFEPQLHRSLDKYFCTYEGEEDSSGLWRVANSHIDACVEMILKLHELKML